MKTAGILASALLATAGIYTALPFGAGLAESDNSSPIFGVRIPDGYRQWEVIAPSHEEGSFNELRVILGNGMAVKTSRDTTLPFPDGTTFAKLAWKRVPSNEFSGAFVPGQATTVQIMVKDSRRYASTGGWGFGRFIDGKPVDRAQHETCFACHEAYVKDHDYVFTRFAY
ncbi:cytochrome P460 family protein [Rhodoplanes sp. Z2-YC6860]|uniref:cytochrome P460 family protein n=1 Tax=Rhodoplanes sp. Z2-YC6860 TaxID=674703 RepID=UPI00078E9B3E|nr:cytochrome P460 family protein [Rhodoplanes sp. Z2-YC6860]AMN44686.1 cytochrome P460 [Rhodoplanes sp. Z2-YC6860]